MIETKIWLDNGLEVNTKKPADEVIKLMQQAHPGALIRLETHGGESLYLKWEHIVCIREYSLDYSR